MSQRPCWNEAELLNILKPDAEEIQDEVFHAVHCETELQLADTADGPRTLGSPLDLVERFLDPHRDYVQAVVLGESGTGKSHLIQWLRLNIPRDDKTLLLTIPRTGTSLRGIVARIIAELPEADRAPYEQRLTQAGTQAMSHEAKVKKFLSELALAVEHSGLSNDPDDIDLAGLLPSVLNDPTFRKNFFLRTGGTVDMIVKHVFVDPDERDVHEQRREFRIGDLPLDGMNYQFASLHAREAIDFIKGEEGMEARAIGLMNLNRDLAIAQTLNFSADHLVDLMNALRRHLARAGKRLILLIEDFARVQGIDGALLQALITPPKQGTERLCEIRWAMAVTTGPFKRLEQTVRGRTTIVVDMDHSKPASLARLTAGYLNALRLGMDALKNLPLNERVPSRCSTCDRKHVCSSAFGETDDVVLFPFTENSINIMARRTESLDADGLFNPRRYMRLVLEGVLKHHYSDLEHGEFPSDGMLKRIGGANLLRPIDRQVLEQKDSANFLRRSAFIELYDGSGKLVNLDPGLHEAFGLPMLRDVDSADKSEPAAAQATVAQAEVAVLVPREQVPADVQAIRSWASDNKMLPSATVNELRPLLFSAMESYIDWDMLGIRKAAVAAGSSQGNKVPFRQVSINFVRQQTQALPSLVSFEVGTEHAIALEAIVLHKRHGSWDFAEGPQLMAHLLESLRVFAGEVNSQLRTLYGQQQDWNPVTAASELLTVTYYLSGKAKVGDASTDSIVARLWEPGQLTPLPAVNPALAALAKQLCSQSAKMGGFLRNHASGTKGGKQGNFVRAWPVYRAVRALRQRSFELSQIPPEQAGAPDLNELADLYRRVKSELLQQVSDEKQLRIRWAEQVAVALGDQTTIPTFIGALRSTLEESLSYGLSTGHARAPLVDALESAKPVAFENALNHARALANSNVADSIARISSISNNHEALDRLISCAKNFLDNAEASAANEQEKLEAQSGAGLLESEDKIEQSLANIASALDMLASLPGGENELA